MIKKGPLSIEELYSESIKNLKISKNKNEKERIINKAIYQLIAKKIIIKGTKITKDSVLQNKNRKKIFEYIFSNPGTHLREIQKILKLTPQISAWHLQMLEKFDFIRAKRIKNKIVYFDREIDPKFDKALFILKNPNHFRILENILLEPYITVNDLAKKVRINSEKVKKVILALIELNFVNKGNDDKSTEYYCKLKNIIPILKMLKFPESKIVKYYGY